MPRPRRKKPNEPAQPSGASGAETLANNINFRNQIMTRSRRKALEMPPSPKFGPVPAKKGRVKGPKPPSSGAASAESSGNEAAVGATSSSETAVAATSSSETAVGATSSSETVVGATSSSEVELVLEQYKGVQRTLGTKCLDVVDRLKLNYAPHCALRGSFCRTHHWETCAPVRLAEADLKSKVMHFLSQERYAHFIKFIEDMCIRNEFPGDDIITKIWELVLTVHLPDHEKYSSIWVIDECVFLFEKIISKFPPCWSAVRKSYTKLLTIPIGTENILPNRNASAQTILEFVVFKLSELIKEEPKQEKNEAKEEIFNFHEWEMKNSCNHNFEALSREQKLDRLFIVLHQIVKVMELDLAAWIPRHVANPRKHMIGAEKPLLCTVFGFNQYMCITNLIKRTLDIYASCVCFSYPPNQIAHLTRLVSLLAVVINLYERSTTKDLKYPNIGQVTKDFVKEIYKVIDGLVGKNIEHILLVIRDIKIPFVKYLLIDEFLFKLDEDRQEMSAKKINDIFRQQSWLECELASKKIRLPTKPAADFKYPIIPHKILKPTSGVIYREEYLYLLLAALKAYCDIYAIKDIAKLFAKTKPNERSLIENKSPRKASEELDFSRIEDDIETFVAEMDLKQQLPSKPEESQCFEGIHIDANVMKMYRSELKCLLILRKNIPVLREKHGSIFDEFYDFTQKDLFGDD